MEGYDAATYGERWADVYDDWYDDPDEVAATVELLARLAGPADVAPGAIVELGIGTGRLALPLFERGYDVRGIDASPAMVERLRAKPGGSAIAVTVGDMADVAMPGSPAPCAGVFVAYNTLFALADEQAQRRCLRGVADLLDTGGWFVCAAFIPDLGEPATERGTVGVRSLTADQVVLTADRHDAEAQTISGQFIDITAAGITLRPFHIRYLLPRQLDDLAAEAGLVLEARWADWARTELDDHSVGHVSVYRRSPEPRPGASAP